MSKSIPNLPHLKISIVYTYLLRCIEILWVLIGKHVNYTYLLYYLGRNLILRTKGSPGFGSIFSNLLPTYLFTYIKVNISQKNFVQLDDWVCTTFSKEWFTLIRMCQPKAQMATDIYWICIKWCQMFNFCKINFTTYVDSYLTKWFSIGKYLHTVVTIFIKA